MNTVGNAPKDTTARGGVADLENPEFEEASERANIVSGESIPTLFGKIKKWFTDLPNMFVSKSGDTMSGKLTVNDSSSDEVLVVSKSHTSTTSALSLITVGNNIVDGTAGSSYGGISLFGKGSRYVRLQATAASSNRTIELPNASGTLALTSEIHWKNRVTGVVASAGSNLKRVDNTDLTPSGIKYIVIQSETSNGDSASVYLLNNSAITIVYEGSSNRSPRLFIESSIIKVKTNGHTGGIPMSYMVWEY